MKSPPKIILVVEDDLPLAAAIKAKLETEKFKVLIADGTNHALAYIEAGRIDGVWLDHYLLGQHDGLYFANKIKKAGSKWKNVPLFVVSNTVSIEKLDAYVALGIQKYYTKVDYRLDQIVADIKRYFEPGARTKQQTTQAVH